MIRLRIDGQEIFFEAPLTVADTFGYLEIEATFEDEAWHDLVKLVHLKKGDTEIIQVMINDRVPRTAQINLEEGEWELFIVGNEVSGDEITERIVTESMMLDVRASGIDSSEPLPIGASVGEQILGVAQSAKNISLSVQQRADSGEFDGEPGPQGEQGERGNGVYYTTATLLIGEQVEVTGLMPYGTPLRDGEMVISSGGIVGTLIQPIPGVWYAIGEYSIVGADGADGRGIYYTSDSVSVGTQTEFPVAFPYGAPLHEDDLVLSVSGVICLAKWLETFSGYGAKGIFSIKGAQGPQGVRGETGATGPQGERGPQGEQGIKGDKGDKGDPGEDAVVDAESVAAAGAEMTVHKKNTMPATPTDSDYLSASAIKAFAEPKAQDYELIESISLAEAVTSVSRNKAPDQRTYNFKKVIVVLNLPTPKSGSVIFDIQKSGGHITYTTYNLSNENRCIHFPIMEHGYAIALGGSSSGTGGTTNVVTRLIKPTPIVAANRVIVETTMSGGFPAGTEIEIYGVWV